MKQIFSEPLFQFLLLGAALFGGYALLNREPEARPDEIIVSAGQIEHLAVTFSRFQQRPPTADELKGLIDQHVREEILSREAMKLGLDQDDSIIRRRLQQKMEFIASDLAAVIEPTDTELAAWLADHPDDFRHEPRFTFRHVYLNPEGRGERLDADTAALLANLKQAGASADVSAPGDRFLLPLEFVRASHSEIAARFGPEFAGQLAAAEIGHWSGPIGSGFGTHLVLVMERNEGHVPELDDVRELVKRDMLHARRIEANRAFLDAVLARYTVKIEWPPADSLMTERVVRAR